MKNRNYLIKEFEKEMWLYIEGALDERKMNYWDEKLKTEQELKRLLESNLELLDSVPETPLLLPNSEFNNMIEKSSKASVFSNAVIFLKERLLNRDKHFPKLAFGVSLIIAAIIFSVISERPHPIKEVSQDILSWNPSGISQKINNVENYFYSIQLEEQKNEEIQKLTNEDWQNSYYRIESDLELIKNEFSENEL